MKAADTIGLQQVMALRQQIVDQNNALQSLQTGRVAPADTTSAANSTSAPPPDFTDTLRSALDDVSAVQKRSSDMAAAYERGEVTDIAQVMLARQESAVAFEATLQVRNKLLSAYQDIMRMGA